MISNSKQPAAGGMGAPERLASLGTLPDIWVSRWVDYSTKYGVGYFLADGAVGVYFNDSTKIIALPCETRFDYITRRTADRPEIRTQHLFNCYPPELNKKVTLLRHFKKYTFCLVFTEKSFDVWDNVQISFRICRFVSVQQVFGRPHRTRRCHHWRFSS